MFIRLAALAVSLVILAGAWAGDLTPPGSPLATPGPEPRIAINEENTPGTANARHVIDDPGSYYLEDNINLGFWSEHGIVIEASNVTVDLNGFALDGLELRVIPWSGPGPTPMDSGRSLTGILASGDVHSITVRNGTVRDWGQTGVDLYGADGVRLENLTVDNNDEHGLRCGDTSVVRDCVVRNSGTHGIQAGEGALIEGCAVSQSGDDGITTGEAANVVDCTALHSGGAGIWVQRGSVVRGCSAMGNGQAGVICSISSAILDCTVRDNGQFGINVVGLGCLIRGNMVSRNGHGAPLGAGIIVTTGCRVESNHLVGNSTGIVLAGPNGSVVVGNTAHGNDVNYSFGWGNITGPILSGAGIITSTNPWANFEP